MKRHGNRLESAVTSILSPSNYDFLLFVRGEIKRHPGCPPTWLSETRQRIRNSAGFHSELTEQDLQRVLQEAFKRIE
jgi:hypothetical protein